MQKMIHEFKGRRDRWGHWLEGELGTGLERMGRMRTVITWKSHQAENQKFLLVVFIYGPNIHFREPT